MHTYKTITAIAVVPLTAFSLAACSSDSATPAETVTVTASPTDAMASPTDAMSPTETTSPTSPPASPPVLNSMHRQPSQPPPKSSPVMRSPAVVGEAGRKVWYITVRENRNTATEVYIDRSSGEKVKQQQENLPAVAQKMPSLSAEQGIEKALEVSPGGAVVEFDLETFRGGPAWYVFMRGGSNGQREAYVDANSGAIRSRAAASDLWALLPDVHRAQRPQTCSASCLAGHVDIELASINVGAPQRILRCEVGDDLFQRNVVE